MKEQVQDYEDSTRECSTSKYCDAYSAKVMAK